MANQKAVDGVEGLHFTTWALAGAVFFFEFRCWKWRPWPISRQ